MLKTYRISSANLNKAIEILENKRLLRAVEFTSTGSGLVSAGLDSFQVAALWSGGIHAEAY